MKNLYLLILIITLLHQLLMHHLQMLLGKNMGKISAWYDNEWGFSNRMCDIAEYLHKNS